MFDSSMSNLMVPTQDCACGKKAIFSSTAQAWYCSCNKDLLLDQATRQSLHMFWKNVNGLSKKKRRNNKKKGTDNVKANSSK